MTFNSSEDTFNAGNPLEPVLSANTTPQNAPDYSTALNTNNYFEGSSASPSIEDATLDLEPQSATIDNPPFNLGFYTVGDTGEVGFDYLLNGGAYQGELGIFSLSGLGKYEIGSNEFIEEASRRALSSSTEGHIVISEQTEGARYTTEDADYTTGKYEGLKTFKMNPGDQFGLMLVPDGTMQELLDNPAIGGNKQPIFSLAPVNPQKAFHIGQVKNITGVGSIWAMEDLSANSGTDKDFNDFVFYMEGAVGNAPSMETLINPNRDWRNEDIGKNLMGDESIGSNRTDEDSNPVVGKPIEENDKPDDSDESSKKIDEGEVGSGGNSGSEEQKKEPEFSVGQPYNSVWKEYKDTLGNPISGVKNYSDGITYQLFENGSIVKSSIGTFPLYGAIREEYLKAGGLDSSLGVPISKEIGLGSGKVKQEFENGYIVWDGSRAIIYNNGFLENPLTHPYPEEELPQQDTTNEDSNHSQEIVLIRTGSKELTVDDDLEPDFEEAKEKLADSGAGEYGDASKLSLLERTRLELEKLKFKTIATGGALTRHRNASNHLNHYLDNSGETLNINVDNIFKDVPRFKEFIDEKITLLQNEVNNIIKNWKDENKNESHKFIISSKWDLGEEKKEDTKFYITQDDSPDWFFAMGGIYFRYISEIETIPPQTANNELTVKMKTTVHVYDRYNWDAEKDTRIYIRGISDKDLAQLHLNGIAQEYDINGTSSPIISEWHFDESYQSKNSNDSKDLVGTNSQKNR